MAVISGKDGNLTVAGSIALQLTGFDLVADVTIDAAPTNETGGWDGGVAGAKRWSGTIRQRDEPHWSLGDVAAFVGYSGSRIFTAASCILGQTTVSVETIGTAVTYVTQVTGTSELVETAGSYAA